LCHGSECFLRAQPGVGEDGEQGRVALAAVVEQLGAHALHQDERRRRDRALALGTRLAHPHDRVALHVAPGDGAGEDALQHGQRPTRCRGPDTGRLEVSAQSRNDGRRHLAQRQAAHAREDVLVKDDRVALARPR
jgi:hypothetical protein